MIKQTTAVFVKDLRSEIRRGGMAGALLLFSVASTFLCGFAIRGAAYEPQVGAALLWVILFFAAVTGLSRTFEKEADRGTMDFLRLCCDAGPMFAGKTLAGFLMTLVTAIVVVPMHVMMTGMIVGNIPFLVVSGMLSLFGVSSSCTLVSSLTAGVKTRGALFPVLAFPLLLPVLSVSVDATVAAMPGGGAWAHSNLIVFLACYAVATFTGGLGLIEYVISE